MTRAFHLGRRDARLEADLERTFSLPRPLAEAFARRGYTEAWLRGEILDPPPLSPEAVIPRPLADTVAERARRGELFFVFGDYDVDGLTSTAIVVETLKGLGAQVAWRLPSRFGGGYGLSPEIVREAAEAGAHALLALDSGVGAPEAVRDARRLGLLTVVLDHHMPGDERPEADYLVDPVLVPGAPPLSAAGLALALGLALVGEAGLRYLDLAAIGTLGDQVPLVGANRWIAREGLLALRKPDREGLRALIRHSGRRDLTYEDVVFQLVPRLNSVGRLGAPDPALHLLLSDREAVAWEIAEEVEEVNEQRRRLTRELTEAVENRLGPSPAEAVIAAAGEGWHRGLIGIVAGRLADRHGRPALLVSVEGDVAIGSARAPKGADLPALLASLDHFLTRSGGHRQAAGFELPTENVPAFLEGVKAAGEGLAVAPVSADALLRRGELTPSLMAGLDAWQPYGPGFEAPVFALAGADVTASRRLGRRGSHVELQASGITAVHWDGGDPGPVPSLRDLVGRPEVAAYDGRLRLVVTAERVSLWEEAPDIWLEPPVLPERAADTRVDLTGPVADVGELLGEGELHLVTRDLRSARRLAAGWGEVLPSGPGLSTERRTALQAEGWVRGWIGPFPPPGGIGGRVVFLDPPTEEAWALWLRSGARIIHVQPALPAPLQISREELETLWRLLERSGGAHDRATLADLARGWHGRLDPLAVALGFRIFGEIGLLGPGRPEGIRADLTQSPTYLRWGVKTPCVNFKTLATRSPSEQTAGDREDLS